MSKIYISELASADLIEYLLDCGHNVDIFGSNSTRFDDCTQVRRLSPIKNVDRAIACHPDVLLCTLKHGLIFHGKPECLNAKYPGDSIYNGCSTGRFFIHNLRITDQSLLEEADKLGLIKTHVPQGYSRCSTGVVDENSVITYDRGIAAACAAHGRAQQLNVLLIRPGHILLPGYASGFIGGTCGRVGSELLFNGDLSAHPDFESIKEFAETRGITCRWFDDIPLTDIGSIIEETI